MRKMNDFGFVFALLERSNIVVAEPDPGADLLLGADILGADVTRAQLIEAVEARLLEERMLGALGLLDDCRAATIH